MNYSPSAPVTVRKRLTKQDLHDLLIIWGRDQRVPSLKSRRQWALHRGLAPSTVSSWFYRRRARHIRLVGSAPTLTDSYDLSPSSPSIATLHEASKQLDNCAQSPDTRSNCADTVLNPDYTVASEATCVSTTEPLANIPLGHLDDSSMSFPINPSETYETAPILLGNGELESFAPLSSRTGVADSSNTEQAPSSGLPCDCVLCVSGALGIF
jgi:hypothetical protein